jgi:hypothetical protein
MTNPRRLAVLLALPLTLAACGDGSTSVPPSPLDSVRIDVVEGCLKADRLTPNPQNPGSYITRLELELLVTNLGDTAVRDLTASSARLSLAGDGTVLGTVSLDEVAPISLDAGGSETVSITTTTGMLDLGEAHCDRIAVCDLDMALETWTATHELEDLTIQCVP